MNFSPLVASISHISISWAEHCERTGQPTEGLSPSSPKIYIDYFVEEPVEEPPVKMLSMDIGHIT